jgi:hypothetical protein
VDSHHQFDCLKPNLKLTNKVVRWHFTVFEDGGKASADDVVANVLACNCWRKLIKKPSSGPGISPWPGTLRDCQHFWCQHLPNPTLLYAWKFSGQKEIYDNRPASIRGSITVTQME